MQHQALKYAPSLINDGKFTQGLSHWFGSYVTHTKNLANGIYQADCSARLAGSYSSGMPYGISQYIDFPEMHSFPAQRTASLVSLYPLGSNLALLVTTNDTKLEGVQLQPGEPNAPSPGNRFQHPFRWQDDTGSVNIEATSALSVSLSTYDSYNGEYSAGSLLVEAASPEAIAHHRLYVSPRNPIVANASSSGYGSTRVECVPNENLTQGSLTFLSTDEAELNLLRTTMTQLGVSELVAVLAEERQVMLTTVSAVVSVGFGRYSLQVQYRALEPGGLAPDQSSVFTEWALFRRADVTCKYAMPLYGYKYTLAYSYQGRTPRPAELTFRTTIEGETGFSLDGFGSVSFQVPSESRSTFAAQEISGYLRNVEVLRAESRTKVIGRPLLNIPVVEVAEPLPQARTLTRFAKFASPTLAYAYCDRNEVDAQAQSVLNMRWEEGSTQNSTPAKLWLGGIVNLADPALDPGLNPQMGDPLGSVAFTGHLAGQNPFDSITDSVEDLVATLLYGTRGTLTAELFVGNVGGASGEELYVNFSYTEPGGSETTPIYTSIDLNPDSDTVQNTTYSVTASDTLGIRGEHWGTSAELQFPRITPGSVVSFLDAVGDVEFLNANSYEVGNVYYAGPQSDIEVSLLGVSVNDFSPNASVDLTGTGTKMGLQNQGSTLQISSITDVSMWAGDRTGELPIDDSSNSSSRDLLERHTDPLGSMFPKGTVMLYAGGGACPAGFKPVQATAESDQPGVPDAALVSPEATIYDPVTNTTQVRFPIGSLPPLLDPTGGAISLTSPATVPVPALSLEFNETGRLPAFSELGDAIQLATVVQTFRNAVEVGMTLRVQEGMGPDSAPLVAEDRGFMVVDDLASDLPSVYEAASAKRSKRPPNGGSGYRGGQNREDVSITQNPLDSRYDPADPAYHWGTGYGTVSYPSADQGRMQAYSGSSLGYNRSEDQSLRTNGNVSQAFLDAMGGGDFEGYGLVPQHPERFTQTPQFAPVAPGIWGQRERFFFDTSASEDPRTDFTLSPAVDNKTSPAILMTCRGFVDDVQIETGKGGGESRIGVPRGGNYGYLPNPAWDLVRLGQMTEDYFQKFPAQPIQTSTDLLAGGGHSAAQGKIPLYEGMVFFCRIYGKCESIEGGVPQGPITGWWSSITSESAVEHGGVGFLLGTLPVMTYEVGSAPALGYEANVNLRPYDFPAGGSNNARGNSPHPTRGGATWPASINEDGYFLLQLTPLTLYGTPNQPQDFGEVEYLDWSSGETQTALGRSPGSLTPQSEFIYRRQLEESSENVTAWSTVGPGLDTSTLTVLGDATGLELGNRPIFVEPSGYLKYGLTGGQMDYGPGRHTHQVERNSNLLGPMNLAQPIDSEGRYRTALPSVHGHGAAGAPRPMLPTANLFTSCIKL